MASDRYTSEIAALRRANPTQFEDDASAYAWGQRYYGWDSPAGTSGAGTTGTATPTYPQTLTYTPPAAPAWTGPAAGVQPTFTPMPAFQYGSFSAPEATGMYADPGYQWRFDQGLKAVDASAASRGTLRGGNQQAALMAYGQGLASQEYQNVFNRALDTYKTNYGVAGDIYSSARLERDAAYDAAVGAYGRDRSEREAAYKPAYDTWVAKVAAESGNELGNFTRGWERETYWNDDAYRRWRDQMDNDYRFRALDEDTKYRYFQLDQQNRQFLASLGNY